MTWNHTVIFSQSKTQAVVALPGTVGELVVKTMVDNSFILEIKYLGDRDKLNITSILYSKIKKSEIPGVRDMVLMNLVSKFLTHSLFQTNKTKNEWERSAKAFKPYFVGNMIDRIAHSFVYPTFKGYNRVEFRMKLQTEEGERIYTFMKFMEKKVSSRTEFYKYFEETESTPFKTVFHDKYPRDPFCPNITHNPKMFSWIQAAGICKWNFNAILPEFISKREQESFLHAVKQTAVLFPMEAVFIGLRKDPNAQVKCGQLEFSCCANQWQADTHISIGLVAQLWATIQT